MRLERSVLVASTRRFRSSLIAATLDEAGFNVATAPGAAAALELAGKRAFNAFLIDLDAIGMTARFLTIEFRALSPRAQLIGFGTNRANAPCDITLDGEISHSALVEVLLASLGLAASSPSAARPNIKELFDDFGSRLSDRRYG